MLWETVRLAIIAIIRNKLRSFLTVLGVVIGVAAVIAMVTVGQGSSAQVSANVASLGTNVLIVRPGKRMMGPGTRDTAPAFTLRDVEALQDLPVTAAVAPTSSTSSTVVFGNANVTTSITGTSAAYITVSNWVLDDGRAFTPAEERQGAAVCILGETVREKLFGSAQALGQTVRIKAISCEVVGLLQPKGAGSFGQDQDDLLLMPIRTVQRRLAGNQDVSGMSIALQDGVSSARGISEITALMRERRRIEPGAEDNFSVTDMKEIASMLTSINTVLAGLLSSVAAVSLLVGGIGIMNIMLVSVTERTREIGIRMAIGARRRDILRQFLLEAIGVCTLGGLVGVVLGVGGAWLLAQLAGMDAVVSGAAVALAFLFSAATGVFFGYYPARKAARMRPVEALRYE